MAEIPVERKGDGGVPWWVWLVGALLLLALLGLLTRGCNDADTTANSNNANAAATTANINTNTPNRNANGNANARITTEGVGTATGARVTDVDIFGSITDKQSLVGRDVELQNVKVNRVLSDRVFTVTSGSGEMIVVLADSLDSPGGKESQIKARSGQMISIDGTFRRVADSKEIADDRKDGDLDAGDLRLVDGQPVCLVATAARNAN